MLLQSCHGQIDFTVQLAKPQEISKETSQLLIGVAHTGYIKQVIKTYRASHNIDSLFRDSAEMANFLNNPYIIKYPEFKGYNLRTVYRVKNLQNRENFQGPYYMKNVFVVIRDSLFFERPSGVYNEEKVELVKPNFIVTDEGDTLYAVQPIPIPKKKMADTIVFHLDAYDPIRDFPWIFNRSNDACHYVFYDTLYPQPPRLIGGYTDLELIPECYDYDPKYKSTYFTSGFIYERLYGWVRSLGALGEYDWMTRFGKFGPDNVINKKIGSLILEPNVNYHLYYLDPCGLDDDPICDQCWLVLVPRLRQYNKCDLYDLGYRRCETTYTDNIEMITFVPKDRVREDQTGYKKGFPYYELRRTIKNNPVGALINELKIRGVTEEEMGQLKKHEWGLRFINCGHRILPFD